LNKVAVSRTLPFLLVTNSWVRWVQLWNVNRLHPHAVSIAARVGLQRKSVSKSIVVTASTVGIVPWYLRIVEFIRVNGPIDWGAIRSKAWKWLLKTKPTEYFTKSGSNAV